MSESSPTVRCTRDRWRRLSSAPAIRGAAQPRRVRGRPSAVAPHLLLAVLVTVFAWAVTTAASPRPLIAQQPSSAGTISGRVVDAENLLPIEGAEVRLRRDSPEAGLHTTRTAAADSLGEYRFEAVRPGRYQLQISRLGYIPSTLEVELRSHVPARVSMGLQVEPVRLEPVDVETHRPPPFLRMGMRPDSARSGQLRLSASRAGEHLGLDVRSLTHNEVVEAVTLAETDLFRALQRTPGVTTRDDFTAMLWTRGASWDQTRVYLDGMPLYNPTHAGWLFAAINPDAVGEVVFYPGARPARLGEGAAAVLDLHTRSGSPGTVQGRGEISLASARVAFDGGLPGGAFNWMIAGRRTYVDLLARMASAAIDNEAWHIPYDFADVAGRADGELFGIDYVASGIVEQDHLRGGIPGVLQANRGRWGNRSGRMAVGIPFGGLRLQLAGGETRFRASILRDERARLRGDEPTLPPLESVIRHRSVSAELAPVVPTGALPPWRIGMQEVRDRVGYEGPFSLLGELAVVLPRDSTPQSTLTLGSGLAYQALWGEVRFGLDDLAVEAGLRIERGDSLLNADEFRMAPRLSANLMVDSRTLLSAGWSRIWQYTQDIAPVAGPLGPQLHLTHLWVLAQSAGYAAIRSDLLTVGVERSLGDDWLIGLNGYLRLATGVEVPNPDSGVVVPDRDPSVQATNRAHGLEMLLSRRGHRWSGSVGYTLGSSRMRAQVIDPDTALFRYPAPADVRHALDAMLSVRPVDALRLGGVFTYGSGVPFTRLLLPGAGETGRRVEVGAPNRLRTPAYASLDLMVEYARMLGRLEVVAYGQLRNALGRANAVTYAGSSWCAGGAACPGGVMDRFEAGVPRLPLFGLRLNF